MRSPGSFVIISETLRPFNTGRPYSIVTFFPPMSAVTVSRASCPKTKAVKAAVSIKRTKIFIRKSSLLFRKIT
jgi:hypothetical protein